MEKFLVPQYLDVEPKILGPITVRQFVIMLIDGLLCFLFYKVFYFTTFVITGLFSTLIFLIIAFYKPNGMPFHFFFLNMLQTLKKPRVRIWKKMEITGLEAEVKPEETKKRITPKGPISSQKLSNISLLVDTGGAFNPQEWEN